MGEKIVIGPANRGLRTDRTAFSIDNDSFPVLTNAYQWRGRVKRKRGTEFLCRLTRYFDSTSISYNSGSTTIPLNVAGAGNLLTGFGLESNGNIVLGSVTINNITVPQTYLDTPQDGTLVGSLGGTGIIVYSDGSFRIDGAGGNLVTATFRYYPDLPVMGLEDLILNSNDYPRTMAFDTVYSYIITNQVPAQVYDVSFYKNPPAGTTLPLYVPKTSTAPPNAVTPIWWNGEDYQQFWTVNYQGALWATNGVTTPFSVSHIGMQFAPANTITFVGRTPTTITLTITNCPLVIGDFVFLNEFIANTPDNAATLNFQTGYVTASSINTPALAVKTVTITLPFATIANTVFTPGIVQYLTTRVNPDIDCIRWYDGDPTNGSAVSPLLIGEKGWVNFCPPLSQFDYSIADLPADQYYLVGCKAIVPFKDRLCFFAPVVQASVGVPIYLKDTVIWSQNGTPYYTASFAASSVTSVIKATTVFNAILVPENQTATANAYFEDQTGFGGWISAGVDQEITTVESNEDVLIVGFPRLQTRFIYTGNDVLPFNFFSINSELGSSSTFSAINMDKGIMSRGSRGYIITSQVQADRIDLDNPEEVFEVNLTNNGAQRMCAQRDYINEWVYFTYTANAEEEQVHVFPNRSFFFNYRDNSWAIFNECYTTYGIFRITNTTSSTWSQLPYRSWKEWNDSWDSGETTIFNPDNIGGNQQGFVLLKDEGTGEGQSLYIQSIVDSTVTSPDHGLNEGDFIIIDGALGTVGQDVNGKIFSVFDITRDTFVLNPNDVTGTYFGNGNITRLYIPFIQTKQFPVSWADARKTRLGPQQYLFTKTANSQITLLIFLSQNADVPYNDPTVNPNDSLIYSTVLYTCPESTNLGLTAANINLNMVTADGQAQIWHRMNTSLLGDTVQIGFTLSDEQMRALTPTDQVAIITGISAPGTTCVITCDNSFSVGDLLIIDGVVGMIELNGNTYIVTAVSDTDITINVDTTLFTAYVSGGTATKVVMNNQFAEIEFHGCILDVSPSMLLA